MVKVSVVIPVYNVEKYLRNCLNSVVNQSLQDIEILVVNDGSQDNSQLIIDEYAAQFPNKIRTFIKENGGLSDARNFGIAHATGDYIAFIDSDDFITPNMLEDMYQIAVRCNVEMVICNIQKVNEDGYITQKLPQFLHISERIELKKFFSVFSDISYFACNKIFHRNLFRGRKFKVGAHFEDIQLIPQLLLECDSIGFTPNYHYQYLERGGSISKSHTLRGLDILNAVNDVETTFKNSKYRHYVKELKGFQILEGVYTFLAYLAFVKDDKDHNKMSAELEKFIKKNEISLWDILSYQRFGKNYLLSLPLRKKIYYLLYFFGGRKILRKIL